MLEARPDDGPDFVTVVEAGLLAKAGLNAAGLGLVTNAMVTDADVGEPGLPYHVLLRAILDCSTVTGALEVLQAGPRSSSANYLVAQAGGAALDIEAAPGDVTCLYPLFPDEDGLLLHTNHFQAPFQAERTGPADLGLWAMPSSAVRLQRFRAGGENGTWTVSARCWPTTPTTRTASCSPRPGRQSLERAAPSPRC